VPACHDMHKPAHCRALSSLPHTWMNLRWDLFSLGMLACRLGMIGNLYVGGAMGRGQQMLVLTVHGAALWQCFQARSHYQCRPLTHLCITRPKLPKAPSNPPAASSVQSTGRALAPEKLHLTASHLPRHKPPLKKD